MSHVPVRRRDSSRLVRGELAFLEIPDAPLFDGRVRPTDPRQGDCLDCYFLATLAAIARAVPQLIEQGMFRRDVPDRHGVRFFKKRAGDEYEPQWVWIDPAVLVDPCGNPLYACTPRDGETPSAIWPLIAEKAFAAWRGGFDVIGEGGCPRRTLEQITGTKAYEVRTDETDPERLWRFLTHAVSCGWPMVVCTHPRESRPDQESRGFHPSHVHAVLAVQEVDRERLVWLRDPFDQPTEGDLKVPDSHGISSCTWEAFLHYFNEVTWTGSSGKTSAFPRA